MNSKSILFSLLILSAALLVQCNKNLQQANLPPSNKSNPESSHILDSLINETIASAKIPSLAAAVISPNDCKYGIQGLIKNDGSETVNLSSKYHIGSSTKAITAFLALKLVESGAISLSTKFTESFPELKGEINDEYKDITLENLLSHNAGIQVYTSGLELLKFKAAQYEIDAQRYEFAKFVLNEEKVAIGTYSNAGYIIAALMLEKVADKKYEVLLDEFMQENKLEYCLGFPNGEDIRNPWGHMRPFNSLKSHGPEHPYKLDQFMAPAGDISMDIVNYSKFIQLNLKGLLGVDQCITSEHIKFAHFGLDDYSLGWGNQKEGDKIISYHDGSTGTFYCHTFMLPQEKKAAVIMINSAEADHIKAIYKLRETIISQELL